VTENWLPVVGYEGLYRVSDQGRVYSFQPWRGQVGRILEPRCGRYLRVNLAKDKSYQTRRVHILVLEAFVGPRPPGKDGLHWDDDRTNNWLTNLRWGTPSDNTLDSVRNNRHPQASKLECKRGHPFDQSNTYRRKSGRSCRACHLGRQKAYQKRLAAQAV